MNLWPWIGRNDNYLLRLNRVLLFKAGILDKDIEKWGHLRTHEQWAYIEMEVRIKWLTVVERTPHPINLASLPKGSGKITKSEPANWNILDNKFSDNKKIELRICFITITNSLNILLKTQFKDECRSLSHHFSKNLRACRIEIYFLGFSVRTERHIVF